jgi:hypothetical protein
LVMAVIVTAAASALCIATLTLLHFWGVMTGS